MVTRESVEELARRMCRELYEFTDGQPNKSRRIVGGDQRAILFAIGCGWLKVESEGMRIGLTDEGRQEVRKMLS
jgi:hypothetical protein